MVSRNAITDIGVETFVRECKIKKRSLDPSRPPSGLQFITMGFNPIGERGTRLLIDAARASWDLSIRIDIDRYPKMANELHKLSHLNAHGWRRRAAVSFDQVPLGAWPHILRRASQENPNKDSLFYAIQQGHMYFLKNKKTAEQRKRKCF